MLAGERPSALLWFRHVFLTILVNSNLGDLVTS